MFLKANELAQGSKTLGRKTRIFTIDFTFLGHHGKQLLALEAKKRKILKGKVLIIRNTNTIPSFIDPITSALCAAELVLWDLLSISHITYLRFS